MTLSDITLLTKKILLGILLVIIPFLILMGGIKLSLKLINANQVDTTSVTNTVKR
ncbi:hypothetical protein [Segetibacter koreensis]|uniref:hypothetical protein n=1 Tax=Segetibacter koreensis TaxID=398037 RepID=UPI0003781E67|nr:hypothetical protein [Segetibacter koreensis]